MSTDVARPATVPIAATTAGIARVLGPLLAITALIAALRGVQVRELLVAYAADPTWPWVIGVLSLGSGLVVLALHRSWRGLPAIVVSVLGWLFVVRGLVVLALPGPAEAAARAVAGPAVLLVLLGATGLVGLYLCWVGWSTPAPTS